MINALLNCDPVYGVIQYNSAKLFIILSSPVDRQAGCSGRAACAQLVPTTTPPSCRYTQQCHQAAQSGTMGRLGYQQQQQRQRLGVAQGDQYNNDSGETALGQIAPPAPANRVAQIAADQSRQAVAMFLLLPSSTMCCHSSL